MMTNEIKYRLAEYVIIERGGILFTWVSHTALGAQLSGRCFIIGNILIIGRKEHKEAGFLKLEFHEQLMKLPIWTKTTFYCFVSSIRQVGIEQCIISKLIEYPYILKNDKGAVKKIGQGNFSLGRYKITVEGNNLISWQTIGELNKIISGKCITESDILFIGPKENETGEGKSRRDFFASLKLLTEWDNTFAWGHYGSLKHYKEPELLRPYGAIWKPEKGSIANNMLSPQSQQSSSEGFYEFAVSGPEWLTKTWCRIVEWEIWSRLVPLFIAGALMVFRFSGFLIGRCVSISLGIINSFRAYHKNRR